MVTIPAPMLAPERPVAPFSSDDWLYELKFDGYRCMAGIDAGQVKLLTKSGADCTGWYPEVVDALTALPGGPHVLDGEACCLRPDGTSDFNRFQERARRRRAYPGCPQVTLAVFDVLVYNGRNVMALPLVRRKEYLLELVGEEARRGLLPVKTLPADATLFQAMTLPQDKGGLGLPIEGVVAKRRDSPYRPGRRSQDWLKIKRPGWDKDRIWRG